MGRVIDRDTNKVLATFDKEDDGKRLKAQFKRQGKKVKMEW